MTFRFSMNQKDQEKAVGQFFREMMNEERIQIGYKQGLEMFITVNECAAIMGCSVGALATRKWRGAAPPYLKMGPYLIRYKLSDVVEWMNGQTIPTA